jgi:hypothetical protein
MLKKAILAGLAALGLTGCLTSSGPKYDIADPFMFFTAASRGGSFPVMIMGQPYPGQQPQVEARVIEALRRNYPTFGPVFNVVPPADSKSSRLIVVFNIGHALATSICDGGPRIAPGVATTAGDTLMASAAYCGDGPYSSSWISLPTPAGPDSEEFRAALYTLIREAVPRDPDPTQTRGNDPQVP